MLKNAQSTVSLSHFILLTASSRRPLVGHFERREKNTFQFHSIATKRPLRKEKEGKKASYSGIEKYILEAIENGKKR